MLEGLGLSQVLLSIVIFSLKYVSSYLGLFKALRPLEGGQRIRNFILLNEILESQRAVIIVLLPGNLSQVWYRLLSSLLSESPAKETLTDQVLFLHIELGNSFIKLVSEKWIILLVLVLYCHLVLVYELFQHLVVFKGVLQTVLKAQSLHASLLQFPVFLNIRQSLLLRGWNYIVQKVLCSSKSLRTLFALRVEFFYTF